MKFYLDFALQKSFKNDKNVVICSFFIITGIIKLHTFLDDDESCFSFYFQWRVSLASYN